MHLFLGIQRTGTSKDKKCIRSVIKHSEEDLKVFEAKLRTIGGEWRIYKTVNARDVKKAYKIFMKNMIDYPEKASYIDTEWRTALLNRACKATDYFMLDIDTQDEEKIKTIENLISKEVDLKERVEDIYILPI